MMYVLPNVGSARFIDISNLVRFNLRYQQRSGRDQVQQLRIRERQSPEHQCTQSKRQR